MPAEKQTDVIKQIQAAWEQSKEQMERLKDEVRRANEMAQAALQSKFLNREKEQAFRDFGEAVWAQMKKGKLQLPPSLTQSVKAMLEMEKKLEAQASQINDLLAEGQEAAERLNSKKKGGQNLLVTSRSKKR